MILAENRTPKERAILDEVFQLKAQKEGAVPACMLMQRIIAMLLITGWPAAFGKN